MMLKFPNGFVEYITFTMATKNLKFSIISNSRIPSEYHLDTCVNFKMGIEVIILGEMMFTSQLVLWTTALSMVA